MYIARLKDNVNEWFLFACDGTGPADELKRRNASRDGLVKIGWVVYSLFPFIFTLNKLLMPFFARMLRYQLGARFYSF